MQLILALIAAFATLAMAQTTTGTPTANLFLPTPFENTIQFVASVFGECHGSTTYGVRCTAGIPSPSFTCGSDTPEFTVTEASDVYIATRTTPISSAIVTITETCSLKGTTEASCSARIFITGSGKSTIRSTSSVLTGTDIPTYYMYQVPVTGGADILTATGNVCMASAATRTTVTATPFVFGAILAVFVFTAAIVL